MKHPERMEQIAAWLRSACRDSGANKTISNTAVLKRLTDEYERQIDALTKDELKHLQDGIEDDSTFKMMKRLDDFEDYLNEARARAQGKHTPSLKQMASPKGRLSLVGSWMRSSAITHGGKGVRHESILKWLDPYGEMIASLSEVEFKRLRKAIMNDRTYMVKLRVAALPEMIDHVKRWAEGSERT